MQRLEVNGVVRPMYIWVVRCQTVKLRLFSALFHFMYCPVSRSTARYTVISASPAAFRTTCLQLS